MPHHHLVAVTPEGAVDISTFTEDRDRSIGDPARVPTRQPRPRLRAAARSEVRLNRHRSQTATPAGIHSVGGRWTRAEGGSVASRDVVDIAATRLGLDASQREALRSVLRTEVEAATTFAALDGDPTQPTSPELDAPVLPSRYHLRHRLGRGGMADVWSVTDTSLERTVALKVLRVDAHIRPELVLRFAEEARITAQLQHPGNIPVYDYGQLDDGRLYFTMKEARGPTLADVIEDAHTGGSWSVRRLLDAVHRCAEAVAYAHSHGVLHRDLKPGNVMVGEFGEVLVLDWGLARFLEDARRAAGGAVAGTPAYMSPEQAMGQPLGPPSDVYA